MADHLIDELWKAHFIDRQIRATLEGMFGAVTRSVPRPPHPVPHPRAQSRGGSRRARATAGDLRFPGMPVVLAVPRAAAGRPRGPAAARSPARAKRCRPGASRDPIYLITPVRDEAEATARETLESLLGHDVYVFGDRTTGRSKIKAGDGICFYSSGKGVVADALIASAAERRAVEFAKDPANWPWAFAVRDVRFYFDSPVVIDANLRSQLDAFVGHGHDPNGPWSFLVQGTRYLTAHDFAVLTRR